MARQQYTVVLHKDEWKIVHDGKHHGPFQTQKEAIAKAVDLAHAEGKNGHDAQVVIQGEDNRFRTEWTYGNDPYPPKG